jgi:gliding motility-associated-like protein
VDFLVDTTTSCAFGAIKFKSLAFPADEWTWDFGDGTTGTLNEDSVFHTYTDTGSFTVKLTVLNNGCPNSITKPQLIHINPPIAEFRDTILNCNQKRTVTFLNQSKVDPSYGPVTYLWQFGDPGNNTSNAASPVFTYPALGAYTVTLTVTNGACSATITKTIELVAEVADFTASDLTPCKNEPFILNAIGSNDANIAQYEWQIATDPPFLGPRAIQTFFTANGGYSVQLTITDKNGCVDTKTVSNYINVVGPTANFSAVDTGGCKNSTISFNDLTNSATAITQWKWDFGDGQTQTFKAPPFTHQYTDTGYFVVQLTVTDNQGCTDVISKPNMVRITAPKADFYAANTLFCTGGTLQFRDSSVSLITGYNWSFGDGGTSTLKDPTHVYTGADSVYTVKLVVTDTVGCQDSVTKTSYVQIKSPKPAFDAIDTSSICPPLETKFILKARDYESYFWDFGDGQTSLLQDPRHFYNAYGTYEAKLYVVGYGGCVDSVSRTINVFNPYTTSISYAPLDACNELNVDFTIAPPANTKFSFFFGDGQADSSQAVNFSHLYKSPSFYSPYLIMTDQMDCQITVGGPDVVKIYGAEPFFGIDKRAFCDSGTVYFTNYTITNDTIVNSVWDFGDGTTSTIRDPNHAYPTPGTYVASLTASTTRGCTKTLYDTIKVSGTPQPIITSPDIICIHSNIEFLGSLAVPDTSIKWSWTLGNGQAASTQNANTIYNALGTPQITLIAANYLGCKDTIAKNVTVVPLPDINLIAEPTILSGAGIVIPATYSPNVISYNWTPSNTLSCSNCPNPFAKPQFTTKYKVSVVDSNGCTSSRDITVHVVCNDKNFFVPNTFSPNADGMNDVFYPRGSGLNRIASMRIFNRWGELVFERKDFVANESGAGWNGTVKGKQAEQDVYIYIIEIICDNATIIPLKGNVALIR